MNCKKTHLLFLLITISFVSIAQKKAETKSLFEYKGSTCDILLQSVEDHQNYVSLELDGKYIGRVRIEKGGEKPLPIAVPNDKKIHHLSIYKATEAANGGILFVGTTAKLVAGTSKAKKKIELIGDSITSGYGNDA